MLLAQGVRLFRTMNTLSAQYPAVHVNNGDECVLCDVVTGYLYLIL